MLTGAQSGLSSAEVVFFPLNRVYFSLYLFYIINLTVVFFRAMMCSLEDFEKKLNEVRSGYSRIIKLQFVDLSLYCANFPQSYYHVQRYTSFLI